MIAGNTQQPRSRVAVLGAGTMGAARLGLDGSMPQK
jgi:hypothetical protein